MTRAELQNTAPSDAVAKAVIGLAGQSADITSHCHRPWASITFSGYRHTLRISFSVPEECDSFVANLPEAELDVGNGWLIADATAMSVSRLASPNPCVVEIEVLVIQ